MAPGRLGFKPPLCFHLSFLGLPESAAGGTLLPWDAQGCLVLQSPISAAASSGRCGTPAWAESIPAHCGTAQDESLQDPVSPSRPPPLLPQRGPSIPAHLLWVGVQRGELVGTGGRSPSCGAVANAAPAHKSLPGQHHSPIALTPPLPPCPGDSYGVLPRPCRALVLLNPQSGAGRALEDFQAVVQPMLAEAEIATTVFITGESASGSLTSSSSSLPRTLPSCCHLRGPHNPHTIMAPAPTGMVWTTGWWAVTGRVAKGAAGHGCTQ